MVPRPSCPISLLPMVKTLPDSENIKLINTDAGSLHKQEFFFFPDVYHLHVGINSVFNLMHEGTEVSVNLYRYIEPCKSCLHYQLSMIKHLGLLSQPPEISL